MQPVALEATTAADLHGAVSMLTDDERSDAHAAAMRFLERRGPDAAAYDLVATLEARRAAGPFETVELLRARSRVRRTLRAAWVDDPRGEAPVRLGCPGVATPAP